MQKYKTMDEIKRSSILNTIVEDCNDYNIYAAYVPYKIDTLLDDAGIYLVASTKPFDVSKVDADAISDKLERDASIFHPHIFSIKVTDASAHTVRENIMNYCQCVEFLKVSLRESGYTELPPKVREKDFYTLLNLDNLRTNKSLTEKERREHASAFKKMAKSIASTEITKKTNNEVTIDELLKDDAVLKVERLPEETYTKFKERIKAYPDVHYHAKNKEVVSFSGETKSMFAQQKGTASEFRKVVFREVDEPLVCKILNEITYDYASKVSVSQLQKRGDVSFATIPAAQMKNFDNMSRLNELHYAIDNGELVQPKLNEVHVFVNKDDAQKLKAILQRIALDKSLKHTKLTRTNPIKDNKER